MTTPPESLFSALLQTWGILLHKNPTGAIETYLAPGSTNPQVLSGYGAAQALFSEVEALVSRWEALGMTAEGFAKASSEVLAPNSGADTPARLPAKSLEVGRGYFGLKLAVVLEGAQAPTVFFRVFKDDSDWESRAMAAERVAVSLARLLHLPVVFLEDQPEEVPGGMVQVPAERLQRMVSALKNAGDVFDQYAQMHAAKPDAVGNQHKVIRNLEYAALCREALE